MEFYILKSSVCLAIFYGFYKFLLEKESVHHFKRFYLLASILLAFGIPLITFTEYIEVETYLTTVPQLIPELTNNTETPIEITKTNYLFIVLWSVYGLGVLVFSLKFIKNILNLITKIKRNPKYKISHITNVLIQDLIVPHTFFNYIFLNKHKFETQQIPEEVLLHEETHAKQKHSLDILCVEVLQIIFWFNPLIYFIKHSIQLNHEFLADQAVLNQGFITSKYQQVLLAFSSNASEPQLAHAINYSSIKKRFTVMKTQTSKQAFWFRSFILLPLLAILIYGFSEKTIVEKEAFDSQSQTQKNKTLIINVSKTKYLIIENEVFTIENFIKKLDSNRNSFFSNNEKKYSIVELRIEIGTPEEAINEINSILRKYGISKINTSNYQINFGIEYPLEQTTKINKHLDKFPQTKIGITPKIIKANLEEETPKLYRIIIYLDNDGQILTHGKWVFIKDFKNELDKFHKNKNKNHTEIELIVRNGSPDHITSKAKNILSFYGELKIKFTDKKPWNSIDPKLKNSQQKATSEQIAEYNKLARKIKSNPKGVFKEKDIKRIISIYNLMSKEQKQNAELIPSFTLPPSIPENATIEQRKEYEKAIQNFRELTKGLKVIEVEKNFKTPIPINFDGSVAPTQQKATPEQIAEYNTIVKKLMAQSEHKRIIKQKDVNRIKYIYSIITDAQKKYAEDFPKLVPPPPPAMDTIYTYNRLAKRVQTISKNRKANMVYNFLRDWLHNSNKQLTIVSYFSFTCPKCIIICAINQLFSNTK